jgi:catechol 2,3-dioxygenase-like lactoylglutathione lyase family enzyme
MKFVHVATRTKDLDAAVRFYEALGMQVTRRSELEKAKATLVYVAPPDGNFDIELVYNWGKDDAVLPGLTAAGGTIVREPYLLEGSGPRIAFAADPDGNWVELIQR